MTHHKLENKENKLVLRGYKLRGKKERKEVQKKVEEALECSNHSPDLFVLA